MLDKLNDDCQLLIINYLELIDQIALWEAANKTSRRLKENVIYSWEHQPSQSLVLDKNLLKKLYCNQELMSVYLKSISPKLQELELECVTVNHLKLWEQHSFPSMRVLKYTVEEDIYGDQYVLELLVKLFPDLKTVKPYGNVHLKPMTEWKELRQLDLTQCCAEIISYNANNIVHFHMLEELILSEEFLDVPFSESLTLLPELKTVCFLDCINELEYYTSWKCSVDLLADLQDFFIYTLGEDCRVTFLEILLENQYVVLNSHLEQLDLINYQFWHSEKELWKAVDSCRSLKIIYISGMKINADFFEPNREHMEEVLNKRSSNFTLHCHNTGPNEQLILQYFKHPKLTLSFEPIREQHFNLGHMEIMGLIS